MTVIDPTAYTLLGHLNSQSVEFISIFLEILLFEIKVRIINVISKHFISLRTPRWCPASTRGWRRHRPPCRARPRRGSCRRPRGPRRGCCHPSPCCRQQGPPGGPRCSLQTCHIVTCHMSRGYCQLSRYQTCRSDVKILKQSLSTYVKSERASQFFKYCTIF